MKTKRLIILLFLFLITFSHVSFADNFESENPISVEQQTSENEELKLYSDAAILIENRTGKVLYEKNSNQKMYPASTTKILTAILTLENGNLNDIATVSKEAIAEMKDGYTSAYLVEGEQMSIENLLKVLLIHSANDAANVLAEYISGSVPEFANLMNKKVAELGCHNTHFVNANGLHDDNHYTTAQDLATISRYCMQNSKFREIVSSTSCNIPATNKSGERIFKNTNDMVIPSSKYYYEGCVGMKTGYTSQAKNCLISAVSKNGMQLISVVLGANLTDDNQSARYIDSINLFNYGYSNYSMESIIAEYNKDIITAMPQDNYETNLQDIKSEEDVVQKSIITPQNSVLKNGEIKIAIKRNSILLCVLLILIILFILIIIKVKHNAKKK